MSDYFYFDDGSGYPYDEYEYDDDYYEDDYEDETMFCDARACLFPVSDFCQCCGVGLCHMHNELGAGFCKHCPTEEWINQQ